tara:strand:- start:2954 stop:3343 length:390 start_codon:yes stop_codon:yes gene_type:complete
MDKMLEHKKRKTPSVIVIILITLAAPLLLVFLSLSGCQTTPTEPAKLVAQPTIRCAPATQVIQWLDKKFNEKPVYSGVYENRIVFTLFVSPEKTFTVVHTGIRNEISCLVSSGHNFKELNWNIKKGKSV